MKKHWLIILNPSATRGRGADKWRQIQESLLNMELDYTVRETEFSGHAEKICKEAWLFGERRFIAVGGDGTVHEVLNGILASKPEEKNSVIGQFPLGTANDWFRSLNIKNGIPGILELLRNDSNRPHDVGIANFNENKPAKTRYYLTIAGVGFDSIVAETTHKQACIKKVSRFRFLLNVFRCLGSYDAPEMKIIIDDQEFSGRAFSANAGISKYSGGGMKLSPKAISDDGYLDLTVIKNLSKLNIIASTPLLYLGNLNCHPKIEMWRCKNLEISTNPIVAVQLDGEIAGSTPVNISVLHHGIQVLAPSV
ncbi:diacylglycerol kinase family lipid kinase [bacterium]|nr:diacylglycerol kinase family lipid kinase [bacterium]